MQTLHHYIDIMLEGGHKFVERYETEDAALARFQELDGLLPDQLMTLEFGDTMTKQIGQGMMAFKQEETMRVKGSRIVAINLRSEKPLIESRKAAPQV